MYESKEMLQSRVLGQQSWFPLFVEENYLENEKPELLFSTTNRLLSLATFIIPI